MPTLATLRHLISTTQLDRRWIETELFPLCETYRSRGPMEPVLGGRALYCLFYEPSFVTRTSFERAIGLLGGQAYHTEDASQFFPVQTPNYIDHTMDMLASLHIDLVVLRSSDNGVVERAAAADAVPVINGGSLDDHPTQALADLYTIHRELGGLDGVKVAVVGRLEHRNVSALLRALALFDRITVVLVPFSGQADPQVAAYCESRGVEMVPGNVETSLAEVDAIYLNGPRTVAHVQLLKARRASNVRIDEAFVSRLRPHCVILDPMQRSGDFAVETSDPRLAFYRQAENALFVRMAVLRQMLSV